MTVVHRAYNQTESLVGQLMTFGLAAFFSSHFLFIFWSNFIEFFNCRIGNLWKLLNFDVIHVIIWIIFGVSTSQLVGT